MIGAGIVGLATAREILLRQPGARVVVLEKENRVGQHQTGHNSGVLHTGIYYKPGSMKAETCRAGKKLMEAFCDENGIPFSITGKVIVATAEEELPALMTLLERGQANGVACELVDRDRLRELEPHAAGIKAIHVRDAGMVDYRRVCDTLASVVTARGGEIVTGARVLGIRKSDDRTTIETSAGSGETIDAAYVVNCAGLHSDHVADMTGASSGARIVPFRGEYYRLRGDAERLCRTAIYPVPDPRFPFLGVHFTRRIDGSVECGPNAVLAFAREGYRKSTLNPAELWETLSYGGFRKLARTYWKTGMGEMVRSFSRGAFVRALQRLVPDVTAEQLEPAPAGVRAQAITPDGKLLDDFFLLQRPRELNVVNAPSPAATASLAIARVITDRIFSTA